MPIVTIRGHYGSYAHEIAQEVADSLDARHLDHELVEAVAKELGVPVEDVEELERVPITLRERIVNALVRAFERAGAAGAIDRSFGQISYVHWYEPVAPPLTESAYRETMERVVHELAGMESLVLMGKGTQVILRERARVLHVFVTAPLDIRVRRVMERERQDEATARKRIEAEDAHRRAYVKKYFNADLEDIGLYDLVLDTGKVSKEAAVETVLRLAGEVA